MGSDRMISGKSKNWGFTLTEIMIVVAIIGMLAAVAVPNFAQARTNSRRNACINNLRLITAAKDQYAIENNQADTIVPSPSDVSPYFKAVPLGGGGLPKEPQGGSYTIGAVSVAPTCDQPAALSHSY